MQAHEYSVINHSRTNVGRYIGTAAATVSAASVGVAAAVNNTFGSMGLPPWAQHITAASLSASLAYAAIHWGYNRFGWKTTCWFVRFPNIDGLWDCDGETRADDGTTTHRWKGVVTISQTWEKLRVHLHTDTSSSNSHSAAMIPEPDGSWMLLYSYRNETRIGEAPDLKPHIGYSELQFMSGLTKAEGDYFTARGRKSAGRMTLTRRK